MFRSIIILLLVNSYGRGLGNPLQTAPNGIIAHSLDELAKTCANQFLVNEINNHMKECNVAFVKPYTEILFQCGLFYDITSRLCAATSQLDIKQEDFTVRLTEDLSIADLCNNSKRWNIADLPNYPLYKQTVSRVFSNDVTCGRLCGGPDVFDVNYYCKFYKWGNEVLKAPTVPTLPNSSEGKVVATLTGADNTKIDSFSAVDSSKVSETQSHEVQKPMPIELSTTLKKPSTNLDDLTAKEPETNLAAGDIEPTSNSHSEAHLQLLSSKDHVDSEINVLHTSEQGKTTNVTNVQISNADQSNLISSDKNEDKVQEEVPKNNLDAEGDKIAESKSDLVVPEPNLSDNLDQEEYQDSREDTQIGDNNNDPLIGDLNGPPYQQQPTKPSTKKTVDLISPPFNGESQRDIYPNMQDSFLDQQEDNFFPFFLTAVILVVLIYVLYHNKSKVSKVVLGLIVEGRQPGRRRNSRGHAYRRLDTLEQAMSSNTAAAPSKIIY